MLDRPPFHTNECLDSYPVLPCQCLRGETALDRFKSDLAVGKDIKGIDLRSASLSYVDLEGLGLYDRCEDVIFPQYDTPELLQAIEWGNAIWGAADAAAHVEAARCIREGSTLLDSYKAQDAIIHPARDLLHAIQATLKPGEARQFFCRLEWEHA